MRINTKGFKGLFIGEKIAEMENVVVVTLN